MIGSKVLVYPEDPASGLPPYEAVVETVKYLDNGVYFGTYGCSHRWNWQSGRCEQTDSNVCTKPVQESRYRLVR